MRFIVSKLMPKTIFMLAIVFGMHANVIAQESPSPDDQQDVEADLDLTDDDGVGVESESGSDVLGNEPEPDKAKPSGSQSLQSPEQDSGVELNLSDSKMDLDLDSDDESEAVSGDEDLLDESETDSQLSSSEDGYQLPRLANVRDPISMNPLNGIQQTDPGNLLDRRTHPLPQNSNQYSRLTGSPSFQAQATWEPSNFYHRPLVFEETNLERYGNQLGNGVTQNVVSAAHFFGKVATVPLAVKPSVPQPRIYRLQHKHLQHKHLQHKRRGDCVPYQVPRRYLRNF